VSKLTLSVDDEVIRNAKRWAARERTSVSRLVETLLVEVTAPEEKKSVPPILGRLRGCLRKADPSAYRRHLETKYR
jgi:hypothetical protein